MMHKRSISIKQPLNNFNISIDSSSLQVLTRKLHNTRANGRKDPSSSHNTCFSFFLFLSLSDIRLQKNCDYGSEWRG